jgi:hypothetical protein
MKVTDRHMPKQELCRARVRLFSAVDDGKLTSCGHVAPDSEVFPVQDESCVSHLADYRVDDPHIGGPLAQHEDTVPVHVVLLHDPELLHRVFVDEWWQEKMTCTFVYGITIWVELTLGVSSGDRLPQ